MFRNLFLAALAAALVAGTAMSAVQYFRVTPLILEAETYEVEAPAPTPSASTPLLDAQTAATASAVPHEPAAEPWMPQNEVERTAYTMLANLLVAAGFALVIGAVSLIANLPITFANGALWGFGGFIVFSVAPSLGLSPALPGIPAAELLPRQIWWGGTVLATGAAALLLAKSRSALSIAIAIALAAAPHFVGAPLLTGAVESEVPPNLSASYVAATLAAAAVFWLALGATFGKFNDLLAARRPRASR